MSRRLQARTDFRSPLAGCPGGQFEVRGYDIALDLGGNSTLTKPDETRVNDSTIAAVLAASTMPG